MPELKMPDLNTIIIVGNLTSDPIISETTDGTPVANFQIASNRRFKDNKGQIREDVCFVGVVAWDILAESCRGNLFKGSTVLISGELQSRKWKLEDGRTRNIVEIKARKIQFLDKVRHTKKVGETDIVEGGEASKEEAKKEGVEPKQEKVSEKEIVEDKTEEGETTGEFDFGYDKLQI
ncbi:MAG: single-stranded DNA-binding protein [Fidelibacterota bacterium]